MFKKFFVVKRHDSASAQKKYQNGFEEDRIALANDWNKVCEYLRIAFNEFEEEHGKELK